MDRGVVDVEHFVKNHVFDHVSRHVRRVERAADDDCLMRRIVMAENAVGVPSSPVEHRFFERAAEIFGV